MSRFAPRAAADIAALVAAHPLCTIVTDGPSGFMATPLPLLADLDAEGQVTALIGHFALANPQLADIRADPRALILVQGPQGYISPSLVSRPGWGPTWNYALVRFRVDITLQPEANDAALDRLIVAMEGSAPDSWTSARMGERYGQLARHIVAFRADVRGCEATFKLGQDEDEQSFDEIVSGHPDAALTALMRGQRG